MKAEILTLLVALVTALLYCWYVPFSHRRTIRIQNDLVRRIQERENQLKEWRKNGYQAGEVSKEDLEILSIRGICQFHFALAELWKIPELPQHYYQSAFDAAYYFQYKSKKRFEQPEKAVREKGTDWDKVSKEEPQIIELAL